MTITWRGPLLAVCIAAVLAVAGCGGDDNDASSTQAAATQTAAAGDSGATTTEASGGGGDDDFCNQLRDIGDDLQDQSNLSDPQRLGEFSKRVAEALRSADPPQELQDEWGTLTDLFDTLAKVMANVDLTDPSSLTDVQDDLQQFQDKADELSGATQALSQYAADHCGGAFS